MNNFVVRNGVTKELSSLRYISDNWKEISMFSIVKYGVDNRGLLIVHFKDGGRAEFNFQSYSILQKWLVRPSFKNIPVQKVQP